MLPVIILVRRHSVSFTVDGFTSLANIQNIMRQLSVILIAATGQTLVLLIGGIDLSVGATIGSGVGVRGLAMHSTDSALLGLLTCLAVGGGHRRRSMVSASRASDIQPFIMTFGMLLTARALAFLFTGGMSGRHVAEIRAALGRLEYRGRAAVFLMGVAVAAVVAIVLSRTVFGQKIYLTGSNMRAAVFSGVDVEAPEIPGLSDLRHACRRFGLRVHDAPGRRDPDRRRPAACFRSSAPSCSAEPR